MSFIALHDLIDVFIALHDLIDLTGAVFQCLCTVCIGNCRLHSASSVQCGCGTAEP